MGRYIAMRGYLDFQGQGDIYSIENLERIVQLIEEHPFERHPSLNRIELSNSHSQNQGVSDKYHWVCKLTLEDTRGALYFAASPRAAFLGALDRLGIA